MSVEHNFATIIAEIKRIFNDGTWDDYSMKSIIISFQTMKYNAASIPNSIKTV